MAAEQGARKSTSARKTTASKAKQDDKPADEQPQDGSGDEAREATEQQDGGSEQPTDVDLGYSAPAEDGREHPTPGGAAETGAGAAEHHAPVAASPLEAPGDRRPPVQPQRHLSTSPVAAAAGQRSLVGSGSLGLVDEEGNDLDPDDVFDSGDGTQTFVVTTQRVYQLLIPQNARTPVTQLLFPKGAHVPRDRADGFVRASKAEAEYQLTEAAGRERMKGDGTQAAAANS